MIETDAILKWQGRRERTIEAWLPAYAGGSQCNRQSKKVCRPLVSN